MAEVASLITERAESAPVIAGPADSLSSSREISDAVRGASFVRNLSGDDFNALRRIGPVRSVIEKALERTWSSPPPALCPPNGHRRREQLPCGINPIRGKGGEDKGQVCPMKMQAVP